MSQLDDFLKLRDRHTEARMGGRPMSDDEWDRYQDFMAEHREEPEPDYDVEEPDDD